MESELPVKDIVSRLPIGVFVLDVNHKIRLWNKWLVDKTSMAEQEVLGKTLSELYVGLNHHRFTWAVDHVIANRSPQILSQALNSYIIPIHVETHGPRNIEFMQQYVQIEPVTTHGHVYAVVSVVDVTESMVRSSALADLTTKYQQESIVDPLTGLYNRRFMWGWLVPQLNLARREEASLGCIIIDIDHFKRLNDDFGHDVGDKVLKSFSRLLKGGLRDSDIMVRYGGEEFVVLLPSIDLSGANGTAMRLIERLRTTALSNFKVGEISCSMGVSSFDPNDPISGEELIKFADNCLYRAKETGRNRVVSMADIEKESE